MRENEQSVLERSFDVIHGIQKFIIPGTGHYMLEAWGAQGGDQKYYDHAINRQDHTLGGLGGYAKGSVLLTKNTIGCSRKD